MEIHLVILKDLLKVIQKDFLMVYLMETHSGIH